MIKYELLPEQLLYEGTCNESNFFKPDIPDEVHILRAHKKHYFENLKGLNLDARAIRKIGFPLSKVLVEREVIIADGTLKACDFALKYGVAMNIAGGTHHAFSDRAEAFCLLNDQAIGARYLINEKGFNKVLIVDLDVHQGNGTAEIFKNDTSVFTFSIHGRSNYPFKKEQSDLDIPLETNTDDKTYLAILKETLTKLIEAQKPDFIFYLAGVDVVASDKLGTLGLTLQGCKERDRFVLQTCNAYNIPVMCSMGGGYSPDIKVIIEAHANTFRLAQEIFF
jgi:acetoin utilization deacetylase AcuC-like enzyme